MDFLSEMALNNLTDSFIELKEHVENGGNPLHAQCLHARCQGWSFMVSVLLATGVNSPGDVYH
jgi:hypothetical protein